MAFGVGERVLRMKVAIASDHGGYGLKQEILRLLDEKRVAHADFGVYDGCSADYPEYAEKAALAVLSGDCDTGILICGTGIGISIAANKIPGIRCALCHDCASARLTRLHNDANMLALGGRIIGAEHARAIVEAFLETPFSQDERHARRIRGIAALEKKYGKEGS